jgi:multisubunit Na+/H+ antiporter MnhF subunit
MGLPSLIAASAEAAPVNAAPDAGPVNAFERFAEGAVFVSVDIGIVVLFVGMLLALYRVIRGPSLVDRGVATDLIALLAAAMVILLTIRFETLIMFDAVLIVSILGFVATIAFAQFIGRRGSAA